MNPSIILLFAKGNKVVAETEMKKEPYLYLTIKKSNRRPAFYTRTTMISLIREDIKLSTFTSSALEFSRVQRSNTQTLISYSFYRLAFDSEVSKNCNLLYK